MLPLDGWAKLRLLPSRKLEGASFEIELGDGWFSLANDLSFGKSFANLLGCV